MIVLAFARTSTNTLLALTHTGTLSPCCQPTTRSDTNTSVSCLASSHFNLLWHTPSRSGFNWIWNFCPIIDSIIATQLAHLFASIISLLLLILIGRTKTIFANTFQTSTGASLDRFMGFSVLRIYTRYGRSLLDNGQFDTKVESSMHSRAQNAIAAFNINHHLVLLCIFYFILHARFKQNVKLYGTDIECDDAAWWVMLDGGMTLPRLDQCNGCTTKMAPIAGGK